MLGDRRLPEAEPRQERREPTVLVKEAPQQQIARVRVRPARPWLEEWPRDGRAGQELLVVPRRSRPRPHGFVVLRQRAVVAHSARVVEQVPNRVELDHAVASKEEHRRGDGGLRDAVDRVARIRIADDLGFVPEGDEGGDAHRDDATSVRLRRRGEPTGARPDRGPGRADRSRARFRAMRWTTRRGRIRSSGACPANARLSRDS